MDGLGLPYSPGKLQGQTFQEKKAGVLVILQLSLGSHTVSLVPDSISGDSCKDQPRSKGEETDPTPHHRRTL